MKKILVVSDNDILNQLYIVNLEVYLNAKVELVKSVATAIEKLKSDNKISIILTLEKVNQEKAGELILSYLKSYGKKTPLIITGAIKDEVINDNLIHIVGKFSIQNILKNCARILDITAKQMATLDVGAFYPISIQLLLGINTAPCNIYQNNEDKKILVRQGDPMAVIIYELGMNDIRQIYVNSTDRLVVVNTVSLKLIEKITNALRNLEDAPVNKKVELLSDGYAFAAANLFSSEEIKQQMQEIATAASSVMADVAKETPGLKALLDIMNNNKDGYIFTHSMICSYIAAHMVKNITWGGEGQLEKLNFVLFFHDIFLAPIYLRHPELKSESQLLLSEVLNDKEKETVMNHAHLAAEIVVSYKRCPMGSDILIKQHHGMKNGKGFTIFHVEDISPMAKVILIAEKFTEEFMKSFDDTSTPFIPRLAIARLKSEFKSPSYLKLVEALNNVPI